MTFAGRGASGSVLREMQRRHSHIAAVVDEYGGVMGDGLPGRTLEDILAEIVGERLRRAEDGIEEGCLRSSVWQTDQRWCAPASRAEEFQKDGFRGATSRATPW